MGQMKHGINGIICLLFVVPGLFAQDFPSTKQAEEFPSPYSHRQKVVYSFQRMGKVHLHSVDSLSRGRMVNAMSLGGVETLSFAVFKDGRLSIGDNTDCEVKVYSPDGTFIESISSKGTDTGKTAFIGSHCIDDYGHIWILDYRLSRVTVYDASGLVQDIWRPYDQCKNCMLELTMRTTKDRVYLSMLRVLDTALVSNVTSLVTAYDFNHRPLAYYGRFDKNVKEISQWHCRYAIDSTGALYFLHNNTNTLQKYALDGTLIKRFNFPAKEYRANTKAQPNVKDYLWRQKAYISALDQWLWSATVIGRMEIAGKYLFVSFVNMDSAYVKERRLSHRHEFLQIFDLNGNCLVDFLKSPGQFLSIDSSGILYFREDDDPKRTIISKYKFAICTK